MRDGATGENLPGVAVVHPVSGQGTTTSTCGFYSLTLVPSADSLRLLVSALGYERVRLAQSASRSFSHDFRLKTAAAELAGVEVVGSREEKIAESTRMGTINVPVAQIKAAARAVWQNRCAEGAPAAARRAGWGREQQSPTCGRPLRPPLSPGRPSNSAWARPAICASTTRTLS